MELKDVLAEKAKGPYFPLILAVVEREFWISDEVLKRLTLELVLAELHVVTRST